MKRLLPFQWNIEQDLAIICHDTGLRGKRQVGQKLPEASQQCHVTVQEVCR